MDGERLKTAQELLDAAYAFWNACQDEGHAGAVQWLIGTGGECIIFTRGEYKDRLMENIMSLHEENRVHLFAEVMQPETDHPEHHQAGE